VVMQFGINDAAVDVWKQPAATEPRVPITEFEANLRAMIEQARQQKTKVILMTTNPLRWTQKLKDLYGKPPYRADVEDGFDAVFLARYNEVIRTIATDLNVSLVDVRAAYPELAAKHHGTIDQLLLDGMHPNDRGHHLVAELLLPVIRDQVR
jgi:lysophospholipase L1-like esterase